MKRTTPKNEKNWKFSIRELRTRLLAMWHENGNYYRESDEKKGTYKLITVSNLLFSINEPHFKDNILIVRFQEKLEFHQFLEYCVNGKWLLIAMTILLIILSQEFRIFCLSIIPFHNKILFISQWNITDPVWDKRAKTILSISMSVGKVKYFFLFSHSIEGTMIQQPENQVWQVEIWL